MPAQKSEGEETRVLLRGVKVVEFASYIAAQNKIWIEVGKAAGVKID